MLNKKVLYYSHDYCYSYNFAYCHLFSGKLLNGRYHVPVEDSPCQGSSLSSIDCSWSSTYQSFTKYAYVQRIIAMARISKSRQVTLSYKY